MAKGGEGKVSSGLVAASCAAILAVYTAGYSRTRDAAEKFDTQAHERRPVARSERTSTPGQPQEASVVSDDAAPQRSRETEAPSARVADSSTAGSAATERVSQDVKAVAAVATPAPAEVAAAAPAVAAPAPPPVAASAPEPVAPAPAPKWLDGTYTGWGTSRHGDIEARVVIHEGRIVESTISQCLTRYSCDVIDRLIPQPVQLQSPNIDYVSRATESSDAYYFAVKEALEKAVPSATSVQ